MQQPSQDLANMLPGPRFQPNQAQPQSRMQMPASSSLPAPSPPQPDDEAARRQARRRMKQASPNEGRNARQSATGDLDAGMVSPTRIPAQGPGSETDMTRFGLAADVSDAPPSPGNLPQRRPLPTADQLSPGPRTPSEYGSEGGSPSRRISRTDMLSSRGSFDSGAPGQARSGRQGSGFRKTPRGQGQGRPQTPQTPVKVSVADMHVVGELTGATGFTEPMLFCRWRLLYEPSKSWRVVRGLQQGATHACCSAVGEQDMVVWEHPLDIHMQTQSLQGWPALLLQVYARDEANNRNTFVSYALVNLPTTPGLHHVSSQTWFAVESNRALGRTFFGWFTGLTPRLEDETFITDLRKREDAGPFICTVGAGEVHLRINVITRNLDQVTHQGGESLAAALERLNTNIRRSATMEERRRSHDSLTEGQKHVRGGREERLVSARMALDARRAPSPQPSDISRTPSGLPSRGPSFQGFTGVRASGSPRRMGSDAPDDLRSETSFVARRRPQKDRLEALKEKEAARKAAAAEAAAKAAADAEAKAAGEGEGGSNAPSTAGDTGAAGGATGPPSRATSVSGNTAPGGRSASGDLSRAGSASRGRAGPGQQAAARAGAPDDDGLETIDAGEAPPRPGPVAVAEGDVTAARAAERLARRARQRSAF